MGPAIERTTPGCAEKATTNQLPTPAPPAKAIKIHKKTGDRCCDQASQRIGFVCKSLRRRATVFFACALRGANRWTSSSTAPGFARTASPCQVRGNSALAPIRNDQLKRGIIQTELSNRSGLAE